MRSAILQCIIFCVSSTLVFAAEHSRGQIQLEVAANGDIIGDVGADASNTRAGRLDANTPDATVSSQSRTTDGEHNSALLQRGPATLLANLGVIDPDAPVSFRSQTTDVSGSCAPPQTDHLIWWQIYSNQTILEKVNAHNLQKLPPGTEIRFVEHHQGMLQHAKEIDAILARCANITGFYEAFVLLRPVSFRSDLMRAALLWAYGGLYMDHKVVLMTPLDHFVDVSSNVAVLPLDAPLDFAGRS